MYHHYVAWGRNESYVSLQLKNKSRVSRLGFKSTVEFSNTRQLSLELLKCFSTSLVWFIMNENKIFEHAHKPSMETNMFDKTINHLAQRYPCCIVWTPIPCLTWFFPFVGHMGIATSQGVIRDFAGPYHVSTDNMAFGKPTKYLQFDPTNAVGGVEGWDKAVSEASEVYKGRMHNLCCDNCHSHVALALNEMHYNNSSWNMVKLASLLFFCGKYVGFSGVLKSWLPFSFMLISVILLIIFL